MINILWTPLLFKNMSNWIYLHVSVDQTVKPGVEKIAVFLRLWAIVIVISRWDGINHKLFRSVLTWIMRKVGQDRGHCAYQYSIAWRKVICLFWQICVERDKGLPRWLIWRSSPQTRNMEGKLKTRQEVAHPEVQYIGSLLWCILSSKSKWIIFIPSKLFQIPVCCSTSSPRAGACSKNIGTVLFFHYIHTLMRLLNNTIIIGTLVI